MKVRARGEDVRRYIVDNVLKYPNTIAKHTGEKFGITRQAVSKHLSRLVDEKILVESGQTKGRSYKLALLVEWRGSYPLLGSPRTAEDWVWSNDVREVLGALPDNAMHIWHHGFTEMFNNAIDHSGGASVNVWIKK